MTRLEDTERIARRVLGGAHPLTTSVEQALQDARAVLLQANKGLVAELKAQIEALRLEEEEDTRAALRSRETPPTMQVRVGLSDTRASATQCALACALVALLVALVFAVVG